MEMACNTRIVRTRSADPWWNLAVEEYLLEQALQGETILYLWQNDNAVLIGRNQNPWRECRTDLLESDGGKLARRLPGGGAVYQDLGNLNFSFITGSGAYDPDKQLEAVQEAVKSLGIAAEKSEGSGLTANGRKFTESAFCFRKGNSCHHGTMYISTDIDKLSRYLQTASGNMTSKSVDPVGPRIVNLSELKPGLDIETMADILIEAFRKVYSSTAQVENCLRKCSESRAALEELYCKYSSWTWRYGKAAELDTSIETKFPWGGLEVAFRLENGIVSDAAVYSDAMDADYIQGLSALLKGCKFSSECLAGRIGEAPVTDRVSTVTAPDGISAVATPDRVSTVTAPDRISTVTAPDGICAAVIPDSTQTCVMTADIVKWLRDMDF